MSLKPDDHSSRRRSRSRSHSRHHHHRSRSRSDVGDSHTSPEPDSRQYVYSATAATPRQSSPVNMPNLSSSYDGITEQSTPRTGNSPYPMSGGLPYPTEPNYDMGDYKDFPPNERPGYISPQQRPGSRDTDSDLAYGTLHIPETRRKHSGSISSQRSASSATYTATQYRYPTSSGGEHHSYQATATPYANVNPGYAQPQQYEYAKVPEKVFYSSTPQNRTETPPENLTYSSIPQDRTKQAPPPPQNYTYTSQPYQPTQSRGELSPFPSFGAQVVDVTPGVSKQADLGLTPRMDRLSVSGNRPDIIGTLPPPSPLLEPYHGTYQSISPMMAPMRLSDTEPDNLPPLSRTLSSSKHRRSKSSASNIPTFSLPSSVTGPKRARVYDAEQDALSISEAISHSKPDAQTLCNILPPLTHDQILLLRKEYKKHVRVSGSRGINIAKHLKMKLGGNFGKAVYVCALGKYESEGYWSNLWYQSHASRRELLIEALIGRTNAEIRGIKDGFKDKRYNDDLTRCMEKELRRDKFGIAILAALEGRRQEEEEVYPREYVDRDIEVLRRCLGAREGGETAMLEVVCRRSDRHLRMLLKGYEELYGGNFAREALRKSGNLVGEIIAHVLNGAINRPARDALLIRHAIRDIATHNHDEELRYELLISRLLRIHWEPQHFSRVKREFREAYGVELEEEVRGATRGDFGEFMGEVCAV